MAIRDRPKRLKAVAQYLADKHRAAEAKVLEDRESSLIDTKQYEQLELWLAEIAWNPEAGLREVTALRQAMQQHEVAKACPDAAKACFEKAKAIRKERIAAFESKRQARIAALENELELARSRRARDVIL